MRKRIAWLLVSGLMVLSLVLASCAPKVSEEKKAVPEEKRVVTEEKKVAPEEKKTVTEEKKTVAKEGTPQYGGVLNLVRPRDPTFIDLAGAPSSYTNAETMPILGELLESDRTKGPAGTREWTGMETPFLTQDILMGEAVESWELDYPNRITFHVRKGVHWQNKPPVNGRELTAQDIVASMMRLWGTPGTAYYKTGIPFFRDMKNLANSVYIAQNDPWAVVVEPIPERASDMWETVTLRIPVWPKELEQTIVTEWQNLVGIGPFQPVDYVRGSTLTYKRNPDYWQKDVFYPQNQLPYIDELRIFIMPDWASRMAAIRTGKIDQIVDVRGEDSESLRKSNPELHHEKHLTGDVLFHMRNDRKPFSDVKVRRAMMMAIDQKGILKDYYKGDGELLYWPVPNIPEFAYMWTPLEQMPQSVQELYEYHLDRAMKLLDEAGYPGPNRFTTSVLVWSEDQIDLASLVAAYWAKVGVTLKIDVREPAVYTAMSNAKTHEQGILGKGAHFAEPVKFIMSQRGHGSNWAMIDKEYVQQAIKDVAANYFNKEERGRIVKDVAVKMLDDALLIQTPEPHGYVFWQPWLKGYHGERYATYYDDLKYTEYVWIDQALKQSLRR
ncbi:MAG: ABC transporter substrate-binding protein [Chloroflexi bacterium]|nr:ABC transporter substrate-binding protein [Chloroflexota bacterium]